MILKWGNPPTGVLNAPIYLARENGMLSVDEAEIVATDTANGKQHSLALLAGTYDMGHIGAPPLMAALSRTREYALVGTGLLRHPPHSLLVPAGVSKLREIRGRAVGINRRGTCSHSIIRTLLAREHLTEADVRLVELGGGLQNLNSIRQAELSAAVLWEPYITTAMRELDWKIFAEGATMWSPSRYCTMIYARRKLIEEAANLVRSILQAYERWVRAAQLNQKAAAKRVISEMPGVSAEDIRIAVAREAPAWCPSTKLDRDLLERTIGELEVQSVLASGFRLDDAIAMLDA